MEEMTKDSPSLLNSQDMVVEAEEVINSVPPADIKGMHTPEELEENRTTFWKAYLTEGVKLDEGNFNINTFVKNYIQQNGNANIQSIAATLPDEKAGLFYKQHTDRLEQKVNEIVAKLKANGADISEPEPPKPFSADDLTNDLAKELVSEAGDETGKVITAAESAQDKFDTIRAVARTVLQGKGIKHHCFVYGDPGCGKTFSVKEAIKYDFPKGALARKGWRIEFNAGDIGRSASAIVAFFYKNKDKKVIVLDDCDSFILSKDQAIQNLLKGMLDLDNTEKNPKYITVSPTIRKLASKLIAADKESMEEGVQVEINQKALREGRLAVSINGEEVLNESASPEELKQFKLVEINKPIKEHTDYSGLGLLYESEDDADEWDDVSEDDAEIAAQFAELEGSEDDGEIPPKWRFASRLIMISNLRKTDLNDAVLSRTLSYELSLTQDEFMARLAQILPHMLTDVETEESAEVVDYAKKAAYAYLLAAVELAAKGGSVGGKPVRIVGKLQFRIIAELAGKWMQRADDYAIKHNMENIDRLALDTINNAIKRNFFIYDVMPSLVID